MNAANKDAMAAEIKREYKKAAELYRIGAKYDDIDAQRGLARIEGTMGGFTNYTVAMGYAKKCYELTKSEEDLKILKDLENFKL